MLNGVPRGAEGCFAPGGTLRARGGKKGKRRKEKKKRKKGKKKKDKQKIYGEACRLITVKLKWSILALAPLCTYNLTFWRPINFGADAWLGYSITASMQNNMQIRVCALLSSGANSHISGGGQKFLWRRGNFFCAVMPKAPYQHPL